MQILYLTLTPLQWLFKNIPSIMFNTNNSIHMTVRRKWLLEQSM